MVVTVVEVAAVLEAEEEVAFAVFWLEKERGVADVNKILLLVRNLQTD